MVEQKGTQLGLNFGKTTAVRHLFKEVLAFASTFFLAATLYHHLKIAVTREKVESVCVGRSSFSLY